MDCSPPDSSVRGIFPGKNTGVGFHFFLQGLIVGGWLKVDSMCYDVATTQLRMPSHMGSYLRLEWGAITFSDIGSIHIIKLLFVFLLLIWFLL